MSDTPETEKESARCHGMPMDLSPGKFVSADFARRMERDNTKMRLEEARYKKALDHCLSCLKSHHMSRPGIPTLVRNVEELLE